MITPDKEARDRAHMRDLQVGLPARRAAVELLDAVLPEEAGARRYSRPLAGKGRHVQLAHPRPRAYPRHRGGEPQAQGADRPRARHVSRARHAREVGDALSDPAVGRGPAHLPEDAAARGDRPRRHARPVRSARQALRQAGQCRAQARRRRRRGDRRKSRCTARQHAGLAVVALGRPIGASRAPAPSPPPISSSRRSMSP